jgi:TPR repeat protein
MKNHITDNRVRVTANCYIDLEKCEIVGAEGQSVKPQPLPWKFLNYLIEHPEVPVSLDNISKYIYPDINDDFADQIRKFKNAIKKNFKEVGIHDNEFDDIIQTRRGYGYVFHPHAETITVGLETVDLLKQVDISEKDLSDILECMIYQGLSGRMGHHTLMSMAKNNNPMAMYEIGELFFYGNCTENHKPDFKTAYSWYSRAAEKNHPGALWSIGYMIIHNQYPEVSEEAIDYGKALQYFMKAENIARSTGGYPAALTSIGELWYEGHYPCVDFDPNDPNKRKFEERDIPLAIEYYKKADSKGYHYATNRLARHYEKNDRFKKAFDMYLRASTLIADGYTYNKLGYMLEKGKGCERNIAEACKYYLKAVEDVMENDITPLGLFNAGRVYANAIPDQPARYLNLKHAFDLFIKSMQKLPTHQHDEILIVMIKIILYDDMSSLSSEAVNEIKFKTMVRADNFMNEAKTSANPYMFGKVLEVERLLAFLKATIAY